LIDGDLARGMSILLTAKARRRKEIAENAKCKASYTFYTSSYLATQLPSLINSVIKFLIFEIHLTRYIHESPDKNLFNHHIVHSFSFRY
jgi:hypothetical protein